MRQPHIQVRKIVNFGYYKKPQVGMGWNSSQTCNIKIKVNSRFKKNHSSNLQVPYLFSLGCANSLGWICPRGQRDFASIAIRFQWLKCWLELRTKMCQLMCCCCFDITFILQSNKHYMVPSRWFFFFFFPFFFNSIFVMQLQNW